MKEGLIGSFILTPPISFLIVLTATLIGAELLSKLSFRPKAPAEDAGKAYACGEEPSTARVQPDYGQFFPFAFFFTILHVVALIVTTVPMATMRSFAIAVLYIVGAIVSLFILFRR